MLDFISLLFELSAVVVGAVSVLLAVICSLLAVSRRYAAETTPLVRLSKLCALLCLSAPIVLCLFDASWNLYTNMSSAGGLYTIFSVAWLFVFIVSSIARLVNIPGRKKSDDGRKRPKQLHISALFFFLVSVTLSWLFS